jgi:PIN domain nuclease of toxin-antitoxin system
LILLDTASWIWYASESPELSPMALATLGADEIKLVSAISVWEVGMLVAKQRIRLDRPVETWVEQALRLPGLEPVTVDQGVALLATRLPGMPPPDPADRMILATALVQGCPVLTPDRRMLDYAYVPTVW